MPEPVHTKAQAFSKLRVGLEDYLREQKIEVPAEASAVDDDSLKTLLALKVKPYLYDLDGLKQTLTGLYDFDQFTSEQETKVKRYIVAMCACV